MTFRADKEGRAITDDLGMIDLIANGGRLGDVADFVREIGKKRELDVIEIQKAKVAAEAEAEKAKAEAVKAKAEAEKAQAEAYKARAEALLLQQQAVSALPPAPGVSSGDEPPPIR